MNRGGSGYEHSPKSSKAAVSSEGDENESEQEHEIENPATEEHKIKVEATEEVKGYTKTETPSKSEKIDDKKSVDERAVDSKPVDKLEGFASAKKEQGSKRQKMSSDTLSDFEENTRRIKATEEAKSDTQAAALSKSKRAEDKKAADKRAVDNKPADKLEGFSSAKEGQSSKKKIMSSDNLPDFETTVTEKHKRKVKATEETKGDKVYAGAKKQQGGEKQKTSSETPSDVLKTYSAVNQESERLEKHSSKQEFSTDKAFFVSATPRLTDINTRKLILNVADIDTRKQILDELRRNREPLAKKVLELLEKEEEITTEQSEETKTFIFLERCEDAEGSDEYKILKVQQLLCSEKEKTTETTALSQSSEDTNEQKLVSEQTILEFVQALPSENERKVAKANTDVDASMSTVQCSEEIAEQQQKLDPKVQQEFSSEDKETELALLFKTSSDVDERKQNLQHNASGVQQENSSEDDSATEYIPLKSSEDANENKHNLGLQVPNILKDTSSENEKAFEIETGELVSKNLLQCSQNIDGRKQNLDTEVEQELSSKNVKVSEPAYLLQSSEDTEMLKQDLDIEVSKELPDPSSENGKQVIELKPEESESSNLNQCSPDIEYKKPTSVLQAQGNLSEFESKQHEEVINLRRDATLRFEFDSLGNKTVLVNGKYQHEIDKNKKTTFNIGKKVKLSFIDNKVSIFAQGSEIDCSMRQNQVFFSLKNCFTLSKPKFPSISQLMSNKDIAKDFYFYPSDPESGSENDYTSTSETDSCSAGSSVRQNLENITGDFLKGVISSCDNFESSYLESLMKRKEEQS